MGWHGLEYMDDDGMSALDGGVAEEEAGREVKTA